MAEFNYSEYWEKTLTLLQSELGEEEFNGWFTDIKYINSKENTVFIAFPSAFHCDRFKSRYLNKIKAAFKEISKIEINLEQIIDPNIKIEKTTPTAVYENKNTGSSTTSATETAKNQLKKPEKKHHPHMSDDYTFDNFIIGENNNFAANAAIAISRNPGTAYNPFFLYGGVGLGKTHLMQAIGNYIYETSNYKVIYVTSEDFLNEYVQAIRENEPAVFKNKFRHTDVLLIDDIQFFQKKESIQEEFFHTFNSLLNAKKQLVMTCDRPPSELKKISDRLISRFEQSLRVDLQPPRYEVRCAILKSTAESRGVHIPDEVIDLISKNISTNIRDLIGSLKTLISYTEIMGKPVTLEIAQQKLKNIFASRRQANLSIEIIQKVLGNFFSLSINDLKGKKRTQKVVYPRQLAMYICREMTDFSTTEIGEAFGGRDHTTVMHSIEKINGLLITDPSVDSTIENLKREVKELITKS